MALTKGMKKCNRCGETKPVDAFYRDAHNKDGRFYLCAVCARAAAIRRYQENPQRQKTNSKKWHDANKERTSRNSKAWAKAHPERVDANSHKRKLKLHYNLTPADYDRKLSLQGGVCEICGRPEKRTMKGRPMRLAVDHSHACCATNKSCGNCVRGLICHNCNMLLGYAEEKPETLLAAVEYLARYTTPRVAVVMG